MQKTLPALGSLRRAGVFGKAINDGGCDLYRVLHFAFGEARMRTHTFDRDRDAIGRERLVLDRAGGLAVDRVSEIGAEFFQIDLVDAAPDLLVRSEQDL